jgi:LssY C-terminus
VSPLYYQDRREDLAFEKPVGKSADRRHHVRLWKVLDNGEEGRGVWLGSITFDRGVGFSHDDARITHHIGPDIDAERNLLIDDLKTAKVVTTIYEVTGIGPTLDGRNGEGDPYYTDGEIKIAVLVEGCDQRSAKVAVLDNPPLVDFKNEAWSVLSKILVPAAPPPSDDQ